MQGLISSLLWLIPLSGWPVLRSSTSCIWATAGQATSDSHPKLSSLGGSPTPPYAPVPLSTANSRSHSPMLLKPTWNPALITLKAETEWTGWVGGRILSSSEPSCKLLEDWSLPKWLAPKSRRPRDPCPITACHPTVLVILVQSQYATTLHPVVC